MARAVRLGRSPERREPVETVNDHHGGGVRVHGHRLRHSVLEQRHRVRVSRVRHHRDDAPEPTSRGGGGGTSRDWRPEYHGAGLVQVADLLAGIRGDPVGRTVVRTDPPDGAVLFPAQVGVLDMVFLAHRVQRLRVRVRRLYTPLFPGPVRRHHRLLTTATSRGTDVNRHESRLVLHRTWFEQGNNMLRPIEKPKGSPNVRTSTAGADAL